jgi:hypothetical protein
MDDVVKASAVVVGLDITLDRNTFSSRLAEMPYSLRRTTHVNLTGIFCYHSLIIYAIKHDLAI